MQIRTLIADGVGAVEPVDDPPERDPEHGWVWIDVIADDDDEVAALHEVTDRYGLDRLAVRDSIGDLDMPKLDDFGHHLLAVFHGLREDRVATYELDCFLTDRHLVTVHAQASPSVEALWNQVQQRAELATIAIDELVALLADVLTRRLLRVLEAFDEQMEALVARALAADDYLLEDLTAVRADLAGIRRAVQPQRDTLALLRHSTSPWSPTPAGAASPMRSTLPVGRRVASTRRGQHWPRPSTRTGVPRRARRPTSRRC